MRPSLIAVAHGTRDPRGPETVQILLASVALSLPDVRVVPAWVELVDPGLDEVMLRLTGPAVVVPLLLSTGHHVKRDLPASVALARPPVRLGAPLGPHRLLARALVCRLRRAGAQWGDAVVLAGAGSADPLGRADVERAAGLLASEWGPHVCAAYVTGAGPGVAEAVQDLRDLGYRRVFVAPYLLAPGRFATQVATSARAAGAAGVSDVLGRHRLVAELVAARYRQAVRSLTRLRVPVS